MRREFMVNFSGKTDGKTMRLDRGGVTFLPYIKHVICRVFSPCSFAALLFSLFFRLILSAMSASPSLAETGLLPNSEKLAAVPASMRDCVERGDLSGAVTLVAKNGKILEFDAVGWADLANKRPMTRETLFWVASMTKPMTAAAILAVQRGPIDVDRIG